MPLLKFPDFVHENIKFPDLPCLEQDIYKFHDFPEFLWPVGTLDWLIQWTRTSLHSVPPTYFYRRLNYATWWWIKQLQFPPHWQAWVFVSTCSSRYFIASFWITKSMQIKPLCVLSELHDFSMLWALKYNTIHINAPKSGWLQYNNVFWYIFL